MWYVYILRSINSPEQEYIGASEEPKQRLANHNAGSAHTAKFKPWKLVWYCAFRDRYKALGFEKYLKSALRPCICKKAPLLAHLPVNLGGRFSTKLATPSRKSAPRSATIISRLASMVASASVWNGTS